ncbi:MAG: TonB-dependent receptor [Sphingomonas sp.]|nr:TonB-dependent receptor [Sphingomonas sp.]
MTARLRAGVAIAIVSAALLNSPALAQGTEPQGADDSDAGEMVIVTGSRIARPELSFPNPIVAIDAAVIEQSGKTNLTDFLVDTPALIGSQTNIQVAGSNLLNAQSVGVNELNLRNLGTSRTLVLVDGRRHVAGSPGTAAVDINTIPTDLVERVDVLTGGASAIYGADGVSGVVNFVLKRDFEGLRLRGQVGISQRGDAGSRFVAGTYGHNFADGRGNITIAYEFNETDRFSQRNRLNYGKTGPSWALARNPADRPDDPNVPDRLLFTDLRWADSSMGGAVDLDGDFTPDRTGEGGIYDLGTYLPGTAFTIGGSSTPRESYYGDFTPYTRRHIANVMAHYEVSPALDIYAEGKYVRSSAMTLAQPTYDFYTTLFADNAYLAQRYGAAAITGDATISRDNFDFGIRQYELERELFRTVIGAKGDLSSHLRYDVSYVFGQSTQTSTNRNDRISDRYYAALDAVVGPNGQVTCRINLPGETDIQAFSYNGTVYSGPPVTFQKGQCVPLNILGYGAPSQAALDFVTVDHSDWARIRQHVVSGAISGDTGGFFNLPGGPVGFAVGAEYRKESSNYVPSSYSLAGSLMDNAPAKVDKGSFDVKEVFGEINLPLLANLPFAHELSIGAALRYSDYSTVGSTTTWNVNGTYAPIPDITIRGTYSEAVRAPNITELFAGGSGTYEFITDPCGPERLAEGTQYRAANCAAALSALGVNQATFDPANDVTSPANSSLLGFQGGNPTLQEETAKTWTAGVVLRPSFIRGLSLTADWYDIRLKQAIQYSTAQDIVDLCVDQPTLNNIYCNVISRSASTGYISNFSIIPANVASFQTAGLDVTLNYRFEPSPALGTFNLRLVGNYLDRLQFVPSVGAAIENERDSSVYPAPKYTANFDLTWSKGPFTMNYGINWWSKTRRVTREQEAANPDYAPAQYIWYSQKWEHELYVRYTVDDRFDIYAGVNNLWDRKPDDGAVAYPISAVGRSFYVGVKTKLF